MPTDIDKKEAEDTQGKTHDPMIDTFPEICPPRPRPAAMVISFEYGIKEFVKVTNLEVHGNIMAACVAFNARTILYLVEDGSGQQKWYPETMIEPMPVFFNKGGLGMTKETKPAEE